eukprot:2145638-Lingulodinium_polyedra.AAC.1
MPHLPRAPGRAGDPVHLAGLRARPARWVLRGHAPIHACVAVPPCTGSTNTGSASWTFATTVSLAVAREGAAVPAPTV